MEFDKIDFNVRFSGDYELLKWIIEKYKGVLPYNGIMDYMNKNLYSAKNTAWFWDKRGVPNKTWNAIHKDLTMARLMGKIDEDDVRSLSQLKIEFECSKRG